MTIQINKRAIPLFLLIFFYSPLFASTEPKFSIDGFQVLKRSYDSVEIEVTTTSEVTAPLCVSATAKSKDGIVRSHTFSTRHLMPRKGSQTQVLQVYSPSSASPVQTESLLITLSYCDGSRRIIQKYDWLYQWPPFQASDPDLNNPKISAEIFADNIDDHDFEAIQMLLSKWQSQNAKDMNGEWHLNGFHQGAEANCNTAYWDKSLAKFKEWEAIHPSIAKLIEAQCWIRYAWEVRGNPYRKKVDRYAMELFLTRMAKAEQTMLDPDTVKLKTLTPLWYVTYLTIAVDSGKKFRFFEAIFNEAIKKYPSYLPIYNVMAEYWAPYTGEANWTELNNLVNKATAYAYDTDQDSTYARLYMTVSRRQRPEADIFSNSLISWPKMKIAFESIIAKYPSATNLNNYASLACRANDKNTFLTLRAKIGEKIIPHLWLVNYSPDVCEHKFLQKI